MQDRRTDVFSRAAWTRREGLRIWSSYSRVDATGKAPNLVEVSMLRLRPFRASDADVIVTWVKDEVAFRKWVADRYDNFPIRPEDMNTNYGATDANRFFPMTAFDETGVVGHMILRFVDDGMTTIRFGFIIVDDAKRGKGYGKRMIELSTRFAFEILGAQKITLGVFANNESAHRCYLAAGFRDVKSETTETYKVLGEDWACLEMEMDRKADVTLA